MLSIAAVEKLIIRTTTVIKVKVKEQIFTLHKPGSISEVQNKQKTLDIKCNKKKCFG